MDARFFLRLWDANLDPTDPGPRESLGLGRDARWYLIRRGSNAASPPGLERLHELTPAAALAWLLAHGRAVPAELEHAARKRGVA